MVKKYLTFSLMIFAILLVQALLLVLPGDLTVVNPFLALLVVLSLKQGRTSGIIWGVILGVAFDALTMPHIGFHGIAFTITGYILGWVGGRFLLRGYIPLFLFTMAAYFLDTLIVASLILLFEMKLPSPLTLPVVVGAVATAVMAVGTGFLFDRIDRGERP